MAAGIQEDDKGYVYEGKQKKNTWHRLKQYIVQSFWVTYEQALEIASVPYAKQQACDDSGAFIDGSYYIRRMDTDKIVVPMVGNNFTIGSNKDLVNNLQENLLAEFEDLKIESVGTLFGGATFFLNLQVDEFQIKGDKSPTINRMMYSNPLGRGRHLACAHGIRVECANTLNAAAAQGAANAMLRGWSHTRNAAYGITSYMDELAELKLGLTRFKDSLTWLAGQQADTVYVNGFLNALLPSESTRAENQRDAIMHVYESDQAMETGTRYTLLNAVTNIYSNEAATSRSDGGAIYWDNLVGRRANIKQKAHDLLMIA